MTRVHVLGIAPVERARWFNYNDIGITIQIYALHREPSLLLLLLGAKNQKYAF